ncbi:MAG: helix-turn-helix domain-containing protein [Draconibacterium sp.]
MVKPIALLLPIYVTFMWALVFLFQKGTRFKANKALGLFMLTASLLYVSHAVFFFNFYHLYSFVESLYILAVLSIYPLFFSYILLLTSDQIKFPRYIIHFVPAILLSLVSLLFTLCLTHDQRIDYVKDILIEKNLKGLNLGSLTGLNGLTLLTVRIYFIAQVFVYLIKGIRIANKHNKRLTEFYSNTEGRRVNWIRDISIIILVVSILGVAFSVIGRSFFVKNETFLLFPSILFSTIYFIIGFYGNQQIVIADELKEEENSVSNMEEVLEDSSRSLLKNRLIALFQEEKIYCLSDLRITTLSETLQTNRTYISRLINEEFGVNFNEFVNKYRVEEAERLLRSADHDFYTLEYIAEKSGFGSANSFTRAFKECKGITPGTFRKNLKKV